MTKNLLIILMASGVLILGLMGGGFYVVVKKISAIGPQSETTEVEGEEAEAEKAAREAIGPLLDLDAFIANLADPGGKRYLRVGMSLELEDEKRVEGVKKRLPQVRDLILMTLSGKKLEDIQTTEGKTALREQLTADLNKLLKEPLIKHIYFTEFVVQ